MNKKTTTRQEQAINTRKRILETARILFEQKGRQNVTIEDIASAACCSPGNIYNYFKNKDELSACILKNLDVSYSSFAKELSTSPEYINLSAEEKLICFFVRVQEICVADKEKLACSYIYNLKYPESELLIENDDRELYIIYRHLIAQVLKDNAYSRWSADDFLSQLVILSRGFLVNWLLEQTDTTVVGAQAERLIRTFLKGMKE